MRHAMERPGVSSASSSAEEINEGPCGELSKILGPVIYVVVSSPQCGEQPFSPVVPLAGATDKAFFSVIPVELQGKSINYFL